MIEVYSDATLRSLAGQACLNSLSVRLMDWQMSMPTSIYVK